MSLPEEIKPEKIAVPEKDIKQEAEDSVEVTTSEIPFEEKPEDVRIQIQNPGPSEVVKLEVVEDDDQEEEDVRISEESGVQDSGEPAAKRIRTDSAPDNLPPPILRKCFMCRVPKEEHELRCVENEQEYFGLSIGWILKGMDHIIKSSLMDKRICSSHFHEAVTEIYKSLKINTFMNMNAMGDEITHICETVLKAHLTEKEIKSVLFIFCRENEWKQMAIREMEEDTQRWRGSHSAWYPEKKRAPPPKPIGAQKRKYIENLITGDDRCTVCSLPKAPDEMQLIDEKHEELVLMIRCVIADGLPLSEARVSIQRSGPKYTCQHHIMGTVREIYRELGVKSAQQIYDVQFRLDQMFWRIAKALKADITSAELKDLLVQFCHINEQREKNPEFEIPYNPLAGTKAWEEPKSDRLPQFNTLASPMGREVSLSYKAGPSTSVVRPRAVPTIRYVSRTSPSIGQNNGGGGPAVRNVISPHNQPFTSTPAPVSTTEPKPSTLDDEPEIVYDSKMSVEQYIKAGSMNFPCSICGAMKPVKELIALATRYDNLAILIIWVINGGLPIPDAIRFFNITSKKLMCPTHPTYTVNSILTHLEVTDSLSIFECRITAQHKFMTTAKAICGSDTLELLKSHAGIEHGLKTILSNFCNKFENPMRLIGIKVMSAKKNMVERRKSNQLPPVKCIICEELRERKEVRSLNEDNEKLILLTNCVLNNEFTTVKAGQILTSETPEFACHQHFQDAKDQMLKSLRTMKLSEILQCDDEKISNWMEVARVFRPNLSSSMFKTYLHSFCHQIEINVIQRVGYLPCSQTDTAAKTSPPGPSGLPETVTCAVCQQSKVRPLLKNTTQESEKLLISIGWVLMGKWCLSEGMKFWKNNTHVLVCWDDFCQVIDRIFTELRIRQRPDLHKCADTLKEKLMFIVNSFNPSLTPEVFLSFLNTWTTKNQWSMTTWKKNRQEREMQLYSPKLLQLLTAPKPAVPESRNACTLCSEIRFEEHMIQLKFKRDHLVMMMAWLQAGRYIEEQAKHFYSLSRCICKIHLKEAMDIILQYLEVSDVEQIPMELNKPLAKLLWYANETAQKERQILLKQMIGMIKDFHKDHVALTLKVTSYGTNSESRLDTCSLCLQEKSKHSLQNTTGVNERLMLAVGQLLIGKCGIHVAIEISKRELPFLVCSGHFKEAANGIFKELNIKDKTELKTCTAVKKQKLMTTVNWLDPAMTMKQFWDFFYMWNWNTTESESTSPQKSEQEVNDNVMKILKNYKDASPSNNKCEMCSLCTQARSIGNMIEVDAKQEKLVLMVAWVLQKKSKIGDAKDYLNSRKLEFVCHDHLSSAINMILNYLKVDAIGNITRAPLNVTEDLLAVLRELCRDIKPTLAAFQRIMMTFDDTYPSLKKSPVRVIMPTSFQRPQHPRVLQGGIICTICSKRRRRQEMKFLATGGEKLVILVGCVLHGICPTSKAKTLLMPTDPVLPVCAYHCPEAIDAIQKSLKVKKAVDLVNSDPTWMDDVMAVVNNLRPNFSTAQFSSLLRDVILKNKDFNKVQ